MAKIITTRPEALAWNGREAKFLHDVTPFDGPAFNPHLEQSLVEIDGQQLYFYANEVTLTDEERAAADKANKEARERFDKEQQKAHELADNRKELFAKTKRDAPADDQPNKPEETDAERAQREHDERVAQQQADEAARQQAAPPKNEGSGSAQQQ